MKNVLKYKLTNNIVNNKYSGDPYSFSVIYDDGTEYWTPMPDFYETSLGVCFENGGGYFLGTMKTDNVIEFTICDSIELKISKWILVCPSHFFKRLNS